MYSDCSTIANVGKTYTALYHFLKKILTPSLEDACDENVENPHCSMFRNPPSEVPPAPGEFCCDVVNKTAETNKEKHR